MAISVGDKIPSAIVRVKGADGIDEVATEDLFGGKKVALFAVPGAFTPTCSAKHLPGFVRNAEAILAKGVDEIVCLSVNDAHVMHAWGEDQNVGAKVTMAADGNGDLTRALGLEMDGSAVGMGQRSQRYSMIVEDGVVRTLNTEEPRQFRNSSAEALLDQL